MAKSATYQRWKSAINNGQGKKKQIFISPHK